MSLQEKLERIRSSPKLQNQQETRVVLSAVEDTLRDQKSEFTPTAYFAALLSLLNQYISPAKGIVNKDVATAVVYLLDLVTPDVPAPLLRSKFSQILQNLAAALTWQEADAPLIRASIGCLESLLVVQDAQAWALPTSQISPRRAVAGLLTIAVDHRPKVRKRAQDAIYKVLKSAPPSPALDHPAADMCAETALVALKDGVAATKVTKKHSHKDANHNAPNLIHGLQLIKTIANASGGWPSRKMDSLCETLLVIAKSSNEYLTMAAFEVFELMFAGLADEVSSAKLPHLLEIIQELQPSPTDTQLLPPWIAVISRGYDVSAQVEPVETFQKLPAIFGKISKFMSSMSENIRVSASECLVSFLVNCIPTSVIIEPSVYDEKIIDMLSNKITDLLGVKYQSAWQEVFRVLEASFESLRYRAAPLLYTVVRTVGELRSRDSFNGKKEADAVIAKAISAMGPEYVLEVLPLHLDARKGQGRAWLLPIMRDSVHNTNLAHFRKELVPLSEKLYQKVVDHGKADKTMEIKIYETVVQQIWAILPGYCDLPLDLTSSFDQQFAEQIANLLYQQVELRADLCRALQNLVDSNKSLISLSADDTFVALSRVSKETAEKNIQHLGTLASNILAVLFNVYSQTLPQYRAPILQSINAYLSITPESELGETFARVIDMLEASLVESSEKPAEQKGSKMPPMSQTLMDLVVAMSIYLPRASLAQLFRIAAVLLHKDDANLQKKAYKLIPRLAESDIGKAALKDRSDELQKMILDCAEKTTTAARRDRLGAISQLVDSLPDSDLHFIPSILPEVVLCTKETNEKARTLAFDLLVEMGHRMERGGSIDNSRIPHMPEEAPTVPASLEEYFTMMSAGLAGTVPHSISAAITALTRILYEFRPKLSQSTVSDLVETMDIFLKSPNREIVRSVLGFVKVSVISVDQKIMLPRLPTLIPNLLKWSHEHSSHLQAKVKHIFERMIRRFGVEIVEKHTPLEDRKLIVNIRKTRERRKKKKAAEDDEEGGQQAGERQKKSKFENEYDEAVYGSDDGSHESGSDVSDDEVLGRKSHKKKHGETYIVEDEDEPLDLLDRRALGHISSTKPQKAKAAPKEKRKAKVDEDGKLVFNDKEEADAEMVDLEAANAGSLEDGINAYVNAIKGRDAPKRNQRGKIKFSNRRTADDDDDDGMEVDEDDLREGVKKIKVREGAKPRGRGGMQAARMQRRGLGAEKQKGSQAVRSPGAGIRKR
ncbi:NUC173-domain-containing protein [Trichodelitschia bisporula]|uniref:NUC173-domain-containing protein n=1 Tax=Trichodelitschia bisporula TaxID=703511 RepID=A0A6G1HWZ2_9PEZI|nr:NUC173-domain-containing protein [Trichodelitschia bisporula]